jgi:signal transduction histidine kinase
LHALYSSQLYVKEIIQNFITNAIKYTDSGSVTLSTVQKDKGVQFEVADTGIGISKADKHKVFDKFFRSEDYKTRSKSGTGLGLYVTMKLARLLHAEIDIESEPGKGSVFSVFIPDLKDS